MSAGAAALPCAEVHSSASRALIGPARLGVGAAFRDGAIVRHPARGALAPGVRWRGRMRDPELRPGVDRPSRGQYVAGAVIIVLLAALAYWLRGC